MKCHSSPSNPTQLHQTNLKCLLSPLSPFQVLFNQFKYFFNLYFLLLACSQFVPEMRLGALYTYWVPLVSQSGRPFSNIRGWAALVLCPPGTWNGTRPFKGEDALRPTRWEPLRFSCEAPFLPLPGSTVVMPVLLIPSVRQLFSLSLFQQIFFACLS